MKKYLKYGCLTFIVIGVLSGLMIALIPEPTTDNEPETETAETTMSETLGTEDTSEGEPLASEQTTEAAAKEEEMEAQEQFATFGNGMHVVGEDIEPDTYRTRRGSAGCYYARLGGFSGELGDILANGNTDAPEIVTILESDAGFQSTRCATWSSDLSQITESKTEFGEGTYIVGTDIEPGTYRNTGQTGCYYMRLSGFTGTTKDIISNNNTDTQAIVTIAATDEGFSSTSCGIWSKQ